MRGMGSCSRNSGTILTCSSARSTTDFYNLPAESKAMCIDGDPSEIGKWEPIKYRFKHNPVHTALLHTGKILAFGGSGTLPERLKTPSPAEIFDPQTGKVKSIEQPLAGDIFCAGHCLLGDGKLLVAGGTHNYDGFILFGGLDQ